MSQLKWMLLLISPTVIANELAITMEGESVEYYDQTSDHSLYQLTLGGEYSLTISENSRIFINPRVRKSNLSVNNRFFYGLIQHMISTRPL